MLAVAGERLERATRAFGQLLMRDEALPVPAIQHARIEVLGVRHVRRRPDLEWMPVVRPPRRDLLELGKGRAVPLVDYRGAIPFLLTRQDHPLGQAEEIACSDAPVLPLLR